MNSYLIIFIIIILIYISFYFIYPKSITILQTTLNDFDFNLLLQKQPLVIGDKIKNIDDIIKLWFTPNIIESYNLVDINNKWNKNNFKYLFIYSINDTEILLYQAGQQFINNIPNEKEPILAIKLKKYQSLIIPFKWHFQVQKNTDIEIIGIHDYITKLVSYVVT